MLPSTTSSHNPFFPRAALKHQSSHFGYFPKRLPFQWLRLLGLKFYSNLARSQVIEEPTESLPSVVRVSLGYVEKDSAPIKLLIGQLKGRNSPERPEFSSFSSLTGEKAIAQHLCRCWYKFQTACE